MNKPSEGTLITRYKPPQWKGAGQFRSGQQALVMTSLERSGADTSVFSGDFRELWLRGGELKVFFRRENRPWAEHEIKAILDSATRLAAAFDKP